MIWVVKGEFGRGEREDGEEGKQEKGWENEHGGENSEIAKMRVVSGRCSINLYNEFSLVEKFWRFFLYVVWFGVKGSY